MIGTDQDPAIGSWYDSDRGKEAANARWAAEREKRAELERAAKDEAVRRYVDAATRAAGVVVERLEAERDEIALRAAFDILDRLLGKALERHEHAGPEGASLLRGDIDPATLQLALKELLHGNGDGPG